MLLNYWRGCVQGPEYTSKYGNLPKHSQKMLSTDLHHFQAIFSNFFLLFLYLDIDPEHSPFNSIATCSFFFTLLANWSCDHLPVIPLNFLSLFLYLWWTLNPEHSHCNVMAGMGTILIFMYFLWFYSQFCLCYDYFSDYSKRFPQSVWQISQERR